MITSLPQDVVELVIAAREAFDTGFLPADEQGALDVALERFSARVPYADDCPAPSLGDLEMANYRRQTCACTAAQRYMPSCPKHGIPSPELGS